MSFKRTRTTYSGPLVVSEDLMIFSIEKSGVTVVSPGDRASEGIDRVQGQ
jgi:hypothetical protein